MNKRKIGTEYERMAEDYLKERGYHILERNYGNRFGEIDLIARQGETIVYCEVKFRGSSRCGAPAEAVDKRKQRKISRTALCHYAGWGYGRSLPCRFDVVAIYGDGRIEHIENAFEFQG